MSFVGGEIAHARYTNVIHKWGEDVMNKNLALVLSILIAISSILISIKLVSINFPRGGEANLYLSLAILSLVSGGMGIFIQSKKSKPNMQNVAFSALFNFVGIGICSYALLTGEYENV